MIGNPPYAQYSSNLQDFAKEHVEKFRYSGGMRIQARNALQLERNLNDDYVKFMGLAYGLISFSSGVLGMITNRMFLESESLVGMREWTATHFDKGFFVDLHGSSEESRRVPRLATDENVFDILQGVALSFLVGKKRDSGPVCAVSFREIVAARPEKYEALVNDLALFRDGWKALSPLAPKWWLDRDPPRTDSGIETLSLEEVFGKFSTLMASNRDHLVVGFDRNQVVVNATEVQAFRGTDDELCDRFSITAKRGWNIAAARKKLADIESIDSYVHEIEYRPFDRRWMFFHSSLVWQMAPVCSQNVLGKHNRILISLGKNRAETTNGHWIGAGLADKSVVTTRDNASGFPLFLYDNCASLQLTGRSRWAEPQLNFTREFIARLCAATGLRPTGPYGLPTGFAPENVLHYIYSLLHAPSYRTYWAHDLVTGFPPVPFPPSDGLFRELSRLGRRLADLHLLDSSVLDNVIATYTGPRLPEIARVGWSDSTVWIDARKTDARAGHRATKPGTIGFEGVPEEVWDFQIGGYQVCHKWLKDRKGRTLSDEDIAHYQKIVVALNETIRIMAEIDEVIEARGGWPDAFQTESEADSASERTANVAPFRPPTVEPAPEDRYVTCVPLVPLKAAAGAFSDPQYIEDDDFEWVEVALRHRLRKGMFVAQVVGKSMEPTIPDAAWCLFRAPVEGTRQGKIVLIQLRDAIDPDTDQRYTVKRYQSEKAEAEDSWHHVKITLKPVNPDFEPIVLTGADDGELQVVAELVDVLRG